MKKKLAKAISSPEVRTRIIFAMLCQLAFFELIGQQIRDDGH